MIDYSSASNYREILNSNKKFTLLTSDEKLIKEYANLAKGCCYQLYTTVNEFTKKNSTNHTISGKGISFKLTKTKHERTSGLAIWRFDEYILNFLFAKP